MSCPSILPPGKFFSIPPLPYTKEKTQEMPAGKREVIKGTLEHRVAGAGKRKPWGGVGHMVLRCV